MTNEIIPYHETLQRELIRHGVSIHEVCGVANVQPATVYRVVNKGQGYMSYPTAKRLMTALQGIVETRARDLESYHLRKVERAVRFSP
jgi:hypothetical protein